MFTTEIQPLLVIIRHLPASLNPILMKKPSCFPSIYCIVFAALILGCLNLLFAQNNDDRAIGNRMFRFYSMYNDPVKTQAEQLKRQENLRQISDTHTEQYMKQRAKVESWSKATGMPLRMVSDSTHQVIELMRIEKGHPVFYITHNAGGAGMIQTSSLYPGGEALLQLTGTGQTLGIWDGGAVYPHYDAFQQRVTQRDHADGFDGHATHVAGTMIAAPSNPEAQGMAYQAQLHAWDWHNDMAEMADAAAEGLAVSQHSYGIAAGWTYSSEHDNWLWLGNGGIDPFEDATFGFYCEQARSWDEIAWNAPGYLLVTAAGNHRGKGPNPGSQHLVYIDGVMTTEHTTRYPNGGDYGYDCLVGSALSKNVITVGAVDYRKNMTNYSSWGPTDDGRIKPDVVAKGDHVLSTMLDLIYSQSGTSMAGPMVSGSVGLLLEHQENLHPGTRLLASTLKALILHTADDRISGQPGPDYRYGWGLMNTRKAARIMSMNVLHDGIHMAELLLEEGAQIQLPVIAAGNEPLRATIVWADEPGTPVELSLNPSDLMLANDLDMRITDNQNNTYKPYILDPEQPQQPASTGDNFRDNLEMVHIESPVAGQPYMVHITHKGSLSGGSQLFSLVISGNKPDNLPVVETSPSITVDDGHMKLGGLVTYDGGQAVTERGVVWANTGMPTIDDHLGVSRQGSGTGAFLADITGLEPGKSYAARAYAVNAAGVAYGEGVRISMPAEEGLFAGGSGTVNNPFLVASPEQLNNVRNNLNAHYKQIADIDLGAEPWNQGEGWEPIGTDIYQPFKGSYHGGGYSISGLRINRPQASYQGLFGYLYGGLLSNITLVDAAVRGGQFTGALAGLLRVGDTGYPSVIVHSQVEADVEGSDIVGGMAGKLLWSVIESSRSSGKVRGNDNVGGLAGNVGKDLVTAIGVISPHAVYKSHSTAEVTGNNQVGGICGFLGWDALLEEVHYSGHVNGSGTIGGVTGTSAFSDIFRSSAKGTVTGEKTVGGIAGSIMASSVKQSFSIANISGNSHVGGLIGMGYAFSKIEHTYAHGDVICLDEWGPGGGLAASISQTDLIHSYSKGAVTGGNRNLGGLIGYTDSDQQSEIKHCFWDIDSSGLSNSAAGSGKSTTEMKELNTYLFSGWEMEGVNPEGIWNMGSARNEQYPFLSWQYPEDPPHPDLGSDFLPIVMDGSASGITSHSAVVSARMVSAGNPAATQYGFCWNNSGNPTTNDNHSQHNRLPRNDRSLYQMTDLEPGATYFVRFYATNSLGTVYSEQWTFNTMPLDPIRPEGNGSKENPYLIASLNNLYWLSRQVQARNFFANKYFRQTADIDATVTSQWNQGAGWEPIGVSLEFISGSEVAGTFQGQYDGGGHVIDGLTINRPETDYQGLFGVIINGLKRWGWREARISNLGLTNVNITGKDYVGALVGYSNGFIDQCFSTGTVQGRNDVGGLVGLSTGREEEWQYKPVILNSYSRASVTGNVAGGLVGNNHYNVSVNNAYSTGHVVATNGGGLIGANHMAQVNKSLWDTQTSGSSNSAGGTGKTTEEMLAFLTYASYGWDIKGAGPTGIWNMGNGRNNGYPYLSWQYPEDPPYEGVFADHLPVIATTDVWHYYHDGAEFLGNILIGGSPLAAQHGFVWSTHNNPTLNDHVTHEGEVHSPFGTVKSLASNMTPATVYHVRAYATNSMGTTYGDVVQFSTRPDIVYGTGMTDGDGNTYESVIIGAQEWITQNLRTTKYNDGSPLHFVSSSATPDNWYEQNNGAYTAPSTWPLTDEETIDIYGALYNGHAANHPTGLCPEGWKVPEKNDWQSLFNFLPGGENSGGARLKSCRQDNTLWKGDCQTNEHPYWRGIVFDDDTKPDYQNIPHGTDDYGFAAIPAGYRTHETFHGLGWQASWWCAGDNSETPGWTYGAQIDRRGDEIGFIHIRWDMGLSVRCMRNLVSVSVETVLEALQQLIVYPNPAKEELWVGFDHQGDATVDVVLLNIHGQVIRQVSVSASGPVRQRMATFGLTPGVYLLTIRGGQPFPVKKVVIEN